MTHDLSTEGDALVDWTELWMGFRAAKRLNQHYLRNCPALGKTSLAGILNSCKMLSEIA
jgi:hypothetical protein